MEGPIGRYARASVDYTGIIKCRLCAWSVRSEHHLGQRTLSAQTGRTSDSKRSGQKSATILTSGGPSTSAISTALLPIKTPYAVSLASHARQRWKSVADARRASGL
jgi:hypothetical protein